MVVAYRERYGITDHTPLGAKPDATQQRLVVYLKTCNLFQCVVFGLFLCS